VIVPFEATLLMPVLAGWRIRLSWGLRGATIGMMEPAQDRDRADTAPIPRGYGGWSRDLLAYPLMRPFRVEVRDIRAQDTPEVRLAEDEEVIQALAAHRPKEAFAHSILFGCSIGGPHDLDAADRSDPRERRPIFGIVIADEIAGVLPLGRGFP